MATMYVYNIPTTQTVNLRATPNGTVLVRVPYGSAVDATPSSTNGWHNATYGSYSGYIQSQYLTATNPNGSGSGSFIGNGTVTGGALYCRKQPISGYEYWGRFSDGTVIPIYACSTAGWHETRWPASGTNIGYVMSDYISMGGSGGTSSYSAIVCQGNTAEADDCAVFSNNLKNVYSSVEDKGFSASSGNTEQPRASQSDFRAASNYDVLYWSSHGNNTPQLNLGGGSGTTSFNSYSAALNAWDSTSDKLKVVFLAACRQLDGSTNRSRWANIMRQSNIRVICGYHESGPSHPYDKNVARSFFTYVNSGSTGNSVKYSWQHANSDNGNNSTYMVLVYYNDNQCYYRLPGFSSQTYRNPNRNSDSIYAYASFMSGAVASVQTTAEQLPYELLVADNTISERKAVANNSKNSTVSGPETNAAFIGYGELHNESLDIDVAQKLNMQYAVKAFGSDLLSNAQIRNMDHVMFEVFGDGKEGEHITIGRTTQFLNHYKGIPLFDNCVVITSDAAGIHSVSNRWRNVIPESDSEMVLATTRLSNVEKQVLSTKYPAIATNDETKNIQYAYVEKNGRYVLHRDVEMLSGQHILFDVKSQEIAK